MLPLCHLSDASKMIRRQDRRYLTRGKGTVAKAPRCMTRQACTPFDTEVKKKEGGPSPAAVTNHCGWFGHAWR